MNNRAAHTRVETPDCCPTGRRKQRGKIMTLGALTVSASPKHRARHAIMRLRRGYSALECPTKTERGRVTSARHRRVMVARAISVFAFLSLSAVITESAAAEKI